MCIARCTVQNSKHSASAEMHSFSQNWILILIITSNYRSVTHKTDVTMKIGKLWRGQQTMKKASQWSEVNRAVTHKAFQTTERRLHREGTSSGTCTWRRSFSCRRSSSPVTHRTSHSPQQHAHTVQLSVSNRETGTVGCLLQPSGAFALMTATTALVHCISSYLYLLTHPWGNVCHVLHDCSAKPVIYLTTTSTIYRHYLLCSTLRIRTYSPNRFSV